MSAHNSGARPAEILRTAARLMALDGWDPDLGIGTIERPRNGRFYSTGTLADMLFRARQVLNAGWYAMVRAQETLYRMLNLSHGPRELRAWERSRGLTQDRVERTLLRAAYAIDQGIAA